MNKLGIAMNDLVIAARDAARRAYCPYSNFPVGAAVMTKSGRVIPGCNVENASYGLTICSERTALFSAIAQGEQPVAIAVTCLKGDPSDPGTVMPCGACRQVMREFLDDDAVVFVDGVGEFTLGELLPRPFHL